MARLIVTLQNDRKVFELPEGEPVFAGRSEECDICLPVPTASRRHAVFLCRNGECGVKDMDSANGTYLNGKRLNNPKRLVHNDKVQIGGVTLSFAAGEAEEKKEASRSNRRSRDTSVFIAPVDALTVTIADDVPTRPSVRAKQTNKAKQSAKLKSTPKTPPKISPEATPEKTPDAKARPEADRGLSSPPASREPAAPQPVEPPAPPSSTAAATAAAAAAAAATAAATDATAEVAEREEMRAAQAPVRERPPLRPSVLPVAESDDEAVDAEHGSREAALNKAASEAGLIGEFVPDDEEDSGGGRDDGDAGAPSSQPVAASAATPAEPSSLALPVDDALRKAIEGRLMLYSFLNDMCQMRVDFLAKHPKASDAVKAELARQDREMDKIPTPEQAEGMIEKRQAKRRELLARIKEAKEKAEIPPPKTPPEMTEAEDMAFSQWQSCVQSGREALPAVWKEAFRYAADEQLTETLLDAGVDPLMLMGGGVYCLALETLQEETKELRQATRAQLAALPPPTEKKDGKGGRRLGLFGRSGGREEEEEADEEGKSYETLVEEDKNLANRAAWLAQEAAFMERTLILEFWRLYAEVALIFVPQGEDMPLAVRAFLRYGVIGFKSWWLKDETREHILADCSKDVTPRMEVSKNITNVLYADEYLGAVLRRECTPALDENLEINGRNSPEWKADKALRKLINSRSQRIRLEELLGTLAERSDKLAREAAILDDRIAKLLPGTKNLRQVKNELGQQRQAYKVEIAKLSNLATKIRDETLAILKESERETEERFTSGELPDPTSEFLIRRECDSLRKIGRLLANLKERFLPLAVREHFQVGTDAVNSRPSILGVLAEMERRDPAIFLETLVASKKKANRVDIRVSPVIVLIPSAGVLAYSWNPRARPEDGRLAIPTFFIRRRIRERQITYLLSDFRWDTSKASAGMDVMTSDTIVAAFMTVRWDWRKRSKEGREKGLIFNEQNDRTNWRRVYEAYSQTAYDGGKKLYNRNYDFYERVIGGYFDLPEGVPLLKK